MPEASEKASGIFARDACYLYLQAICFVTEQELFFGSIKLCQFPGIKSNEKHESGCQNARQYLISVLSHGILLACFFVSIFLTCPIFDRQIREKTRKMEQEFILRYSL